MALIAAVGALAGVASARPASAPLTIVSVTALPPPAQRAGGLLRPAKLNVVFSAGFIGLRIELRDGGSAPARHVAVKLSIRRGAGSSPLVRSETLGAVGPGQTATLTFSRVGMVPFAMQTSLSIEVTGQNHVYPVVFALQD